MTVVAAKALEEFNPSKIKARKSRPGESEKRKASRLASATRKAEREWVLKRLSSMYCKLGRRIDDSRISKYEPFVRSIIPKLLPACRLFEASMEYEDLCNQLRYEVMLALRDSFDPAKAMAPAKKVKNHEKSAANQARKLENPEHTLEKAERRSVYERLKNYMLRVRWKFHPGTIGGQSVSYEAALIETNLDMDGVAQDGFVTSGYSPVQQEKIRTDIDIGALLVALEKGCDVREIYAAMPEEQKEDLKDYLYTYSDRPELEVKTETPGSEKGLSV